VPILSIHEIVAYRYAGRKWGSRENGGESVITVIDLQAELAKLTMLRDRTPQMTRAERQGSSAKLAEYRDSGIFASRFAGKGYWERHPNGDELVQIIEGAATLHLMTENGLQSLALNRGMVAVVPQGAWHRFESPDGVSLMTATPQPSEHLYGDVEDPRTAEISKSG
jgi:mannose-6-phosphate isomerase-like protein (cupin superfamily)